MGKIVAEVAKIDDRGRIRLPKEMAGNAKSVVIIDSGGFFLGILVPADPLQASGSWLKNQEDTKSLKKAADAEALKDAVDRAKRRRQLDDD